MPPNRLNRVNDPEPVVIKSTRNQLRNARRRVRLFDTDASFDRDDVLPVQRRKGLLPTPSTASRQFTQQPGSQHTQLNNQLQVQQQQTQQRQRVQQQSDNSAQSHFCSSLPFSLWLPAASETISSTLAHLDILKQQALMADHSLQETDAELPIQINGYHGLVECDYRWLVDCLYHGPLAQGIGDALQRTIYERANLPFIREDHVNLNDAIYSHSNNFQQWHDEPFENFRTRRDKAILRMDQAANLLINVPRVQSLIFLGGHYITVDLDNTARKITVYDSIRNPYHAEMLCARMTRITGVQYTYLCPYVAQQQSAVDAGIGNDCCIHASINLEFILNNLPPPRLILREILTGRRVLAVRAFLTLSINRRSITTLPYSTQNVNHRTSSEPSPTSTVDTPVTTAQSATLTAESPTPAMQTAESTTSSLFTGLSSSPEQSNHSTGYQLRSKGGVVSVTEEKTVKSPKLLKRERAAKPNEQLTRIEVAALTKWVNDEHSTDLNSNAARQLLLSELPDEPVMKKSKEECILKFFEVTRVKQNQTFDAINYSIVHRHLLADAHHRVVTDLRLTDKDDKISAKQAREITEKWLKTHKK